MIYNTLLVSYQHGVELAVIVLDKGVNKESVETPDPQAIYLEYNSTIGCYDQYLFQAQNWRKIGTTQIISGEGTIEWGKF